MKPKPSKRSKPVTRRRFLAGLGAAGAVAAGGGYAVSVWTGGDPGRAARRAPRPSSSGVRVDAARAVAASGRTLVLLELGGGNDGLSLVVPHADGRYHDLRPTLAVTDPVDLDGDIGLHPALTTLAAEYEAGRLAIVEGVGYPAPDLSHFASMQVWWTADPEARVGPGWLGRFLDATVGYDDPLAGITIGPAPSPALRGEASFATSITDARGLEPALPIADAARDELLDTWAGFGDPEGHGRVGSVRRAIASTADARTRLAAVLTGGERGGAGAAPGPIAAALTLAARLAAADAPPRVVLVHADGDFDTHQGQAQRYPALAAALEEGFAAFLATVRSLGAADRVLLATTSEFGRRAAENGSGTDHGTAAPHLVLGEAVVGGRHGAPPDLAALDPAGNLVATTDFRSYYATLLARWLGTDPEAVVGAGHEPLGFLPPP